MDDGAHHGDRELLEGNQLSDKCKELNLGHEFDISQNVFGIPLVRSKHRGPIGKWMGVLPGDTKGYRLCGHR